MQAGVKGESLSSPRREEPRLDTSVPRSGADKVAYQIDLLLWKRYKELQKQPFEIAKYMLPPLLFYSFICLIYGAIKPPMFYPGGVALYIVPLAFWMYVQKTVVNIMFEKQNKLQEAMRMMGLSDISYWISYFISEGIVIGLLQSLLGACLSIYEPVFNDGNFFNILGLLFAASLSLTTFAFFLCSFFDTPQTAGQATIAVLLFLYIVFIAVDIHLQSRAAQYLWCLIPPLALQLGCASFLRSYQKRDGLEAFYVSCVMLCDVVLYSILAWYFAQVWPSKVTPCEV